jgi:CRP-like cAMP-binding protein
METTPHALLFRRLEAYGPLSPTLRHDLSQRFKVRNLPKKKLLPPPGTPPRAACFVASGLLKAYHFAECGRCVVEGFVTEGEFVYLEAPYLEATENTLLLEIAAPETEWLYRQHPGVERMARLLTEQYLAGQRGMLRILRIPRPADRLQAFQSQYPALIPRLKRQDLASYLNLSPCTLSRLLSEEGFLEVG